MTTTPKYQLPGRDGGFFYRDDEQLRRSFRLWVRWLPCSVLWNMAVWNYSHSKPVSKRRSLLHILLAGGSAAIVGTILMLFTGACLAVSIYLVILLVIMAFSAGAVLAS
jgi:hypothetical protein